MSPPCPLYRHQSGCGGDVSKSGGDNWEVLYAPHPRTNLSAARDDHRIGKLSCRKQRPEKHYFKGRAFVL
jgi:hypothetical protein